MKEFIQQSERALDRRQRLLKQEFGHLSTRVTQGLPQANGHVRRIGFCATSPGEGCSSVATNYALFCGQQGLRTTLIEADLRRPSLARFFGVAEDPGLREVLEGTAEVLEVIHEQVAPGVNLLPAGRGPSDVLIGASSFDLKPVFDELDAFNDVLVVDVPEEIQVERVALRNGLSEAEVRAILAAQATRAQRLAAADDVIENRGTIDALREQVAALHRKYLEYSKAAQ